MPFSKFELTPDLESSAWKAAGILTTCEIEVVSIQHQSAGITTLLELAPSTEESWLQLCLERSSVPYPLESSAFHLMIDFQQRSIYHFSRQSVLKAAACSIILLSTPKRRVVRYLQTVPEVLSRRWLISPEQMRWMSRQARALPAEVRRDIIDLFKQVFRAFNDPLLVSYTRMWRQLLNSGSARSFTI